MGHITHTCTQHSRSSPSIHRTPPSSGSSYLLLSSLMLSLQQTDTRSLYLRCWFLRNGPAASVVPFVERGSDTTVGSRGEPEGPPTSKVEQPHKLERVCHTLTQNLKAMSLWVLSLIKCSTSTFLFHVRHITHTCT